MRDVEALFDRRCEVEAEQERTEYEFAPAYKCPICPGASWIDPNCPVCNGEGRVSAKTIDDLLTQLFAG